MSDEVDDADVDDDVDIDVDVTPDDIPDSGFSKVAPPPPSVNSDEPVAKSQHHNVFQEHSPETPQLSLDEVVEEVLEGKWGEGKQRERALRSAGYAYLKVEAEVRRRQAAEE